MRIKDIRSALDIFKEASIKQTEATEQGDYKTGNKYYNIIINVVAFLKKENAIDNLYPYLFDSSIGVRLWSSYYFLPINEKEGIRVLEEIANSNEIHSHTAQITLNEWKKVNLKL